MKTFGDFVLVFDTPLWPISVDLSNLLPLRFNQTTVTEVMNWMRQSAEQELVTPESVDVYVEYCWNRLLIPYCRAHRVRKSELQRIAMVCL
jgi:hypothetical protein